MPHDRSRDDENRLEIVVEKRRRVADVSAHGTAASASERSRLPTGQTEGKADLKVRTTRKTMKGRPEGPPYDDD